MKVTYLRTPIRRATDTRPVAPGLLTPRFVYDFAKARADVLRASIASNSK
jgi:hypothetical protein